MNTSRFALTILFGLPLALPGQTLSQQAQIQANSFWSRLTRCGDTAYVAFKTGEVDAFKNAQIVVQSQPLNEADRLNGWEWKGVTGFTATATRMWVPRETLGVYGPLGWQPWVPGTGPAGMFGIYTASVEKLHGTWRVVPNPAGPWSEMKAFDCSQIPPERFEPNSALVQQAMKARACEKFMAEATGTNPLNTYDHMALQRWMNTDPDRQGQPGSGLDPKACRDEKGNTVLMIAARYGGPVDVIQALLGMGVDINARNYAGETALSLAQEAARRAVFNHFNPDEPNRVISLLQNGMTPPTPQKSPKKKGAPPPMVQGSGPEFTMWTGIKNQLIAANGGYYFESSLRNAAVPRLKGTVVGGRPTCNPKELLVAISDASNAEVNVRLQTPLNGILRLGIQIEWEGVPSAFTKSPFLLTMETPNSKFSATGIVQVSPCTP